jgi:CRP-like cAMP-binding protein|tara:strand:- start:65744 stop:66328 length:585 start_codon:yes stop_codon:yes gene_type:complete
MNHFFEEILSDLKSKALSLKKGGMLFLQNDETINMYFIKEGRLKLQRETLEGLTIIQHVAFKGEIIAEASLFSQNYHCSALADTNTDVSYIRKIDLLNYLDRNPTAMRQLLVLYADQIKNLRALNEIKNIRSAKERTLAFLRSEMDANSEVKLSISLKDVAYRIGLSHEAFYRTLKDFETTKLIIRHKQLIKLL